MNEDDVNVTVKFIELRCPVCNQLLLRVAGIGCVIEIKCWRNDCSKPLLRYPTPQFEIVKAIPKAKLISPAPT